MILPRSCKFKMPIYMLKIVWIVAILSLLVTTCIADNHHSKQCFYPSGGVASTFPCRNDTEVSHCCAYGYFCLSNGLCKPGPNNENLYRAHYHRSGCTDHTWQSPQCPNVCRGEGDNLDATQGLAVCDEKKGIFCCQRDFDCCANSTLHIQLGQGEILRSIVRPTSTIEFEEEATPERNHSHDMIVGVASGFSIAAGIAIIAWIFIFVRRRFQQKSLENEEYPGPTLTKAELDAENTVPSMRTNPFRIGGERNPAELESDLNARNELETMPTTGTRSGSDSFTLSPVTPGSATDYFGTLVTPVLVEMEAPLIKKRNDGEEKAEG